ncbi:MAG TPA: GAF domain-containing protein [Dehalococcoidia bacterium]|nr:GAF domain-containing protein [Dehalococcoidia bacterium]
MAEAPPISPELRSIVLAIVELQPLADVLRRLAEAALKLTDADYAAIGAYDEDRELQHFETVGITADEHAALPHAPIGAGLIGQFADHAETINVPHLGSHPASAGTPQGHPAMDAFLGVAIRYGPQSLGAFYVTRRPDGDAFTDDDRAQLESLAPYAAIAIRNAEAMEAEQQRNETQAELDRYALRDSIARDLHDDVIQSIYAVGLGLRAGRTSGSEEKDLAIDRAAAELQAVIADLRTYIHHLSSDIDDVTPSDVLIGRLQELATQGARPEWSLDFDVASISIEPAFGRQLYLIIREAISNVRRHATAESASLAVSIDGSMLTVRVVDDGVGFDRAAVPDSAVGLRSIEQRVADLDGSVLIESTLGAGTTITVTVPLMTERD